MKVEVYYGSLKKAGAKNKAFANLADRALSYSRDEPHAKFRVEVDTDRMALDEMEALVPLLEETEDKRAIRVISALGAFKEGDWDKKIPSYPAFARGLQDFLKTHHDRGWLFYEKGGIMYPAAIGSIRQHTPHRTDRDEKPYTVLTLTAFGPSDGHRTGPGFSTISVSRTWGPSDVTRKSIPDLFRRIAMFRAVEIADPPTTTDEEDLI